MLGKTISHYPALRDPARREKILEKFGGDLSSFVVSRELNHDWKDRFTLSYSGEIG